MGDALPESCGGCTEKAQTTAMEQALTLTPPPGFRPITPIDALMEAFAPMYRSDDADGHLSLGFFVDRQHTNPRGDCHGGTWATMADLQMGMNVGTLTGRSGPTVTLSLDFLGAAKTGQWVEGRARLMRETRQLAFMDATFTADGELALRANGIFRLKWAPHPGITNG